MRFDEVLKEEIRKGMLVRNSYYLPEDVKSKCSEPEIVDKYNEMVFYLLNARGVDIKSFEWYVERAFDIWVEIEPEFPCFSEEEVREVVRINVGYVDFQKCAEIAIELTNYGPLGFGGISDIARRCESFKGLCDNSLSRVLSRVLKYLENAGLLIKTWGIGKGGRRSKSRYFRIYRRFGKERKYEELIKELKKLIEKYESS